MSADPGVTLRPWPVAAARRLVTGRPLDPAPWHPGYPTADTVDALALALAAHDAVGRAPTSSSPWWVQEIWVDGEVVGDVGFHGPPAADGPVEVEVGYAVVADRRGRGIATRACRLLLERAWEHGAQRVLAEVEPDNVASRRVLERCGFRPRPDGGWAVERPDGGPR